MSGDSSAYGRRPQFHATEHLASEAVAAYVDGELRMNAYLRAAQHLAACPECAAEVEAQQQARIALRRSGAVSAPHGLHDSLSRIPFAEPQPGAAHRENRRDEAVFGFLSESFTATRWTTWWRK